MTTPHIVSSTSGRSENHINQMSSKTDFFMLTLLYYRTKLEKSREKRSKIQKIFHFIRHKGIDLGGKRHKGHENFEYRILNAEYKGSEGTKP